MVYSMAHRTGSFNSFLGDFTSQKHSIARRTASSSSHRISESSIFPRPVTPVAYRASEAHIHRIRCATTRGDFQRNIQVLSTNVAKTPEKQVSSESDNEEVESVDWTSPLDITTYLYKPEFIIRPSSGASKERIPSVLEQTDEKESSLSGKLPPISGERSEYAPRKEDLVDSYIEASMNKNRKGLFKRNIFDYATFIRELHDEIRDMSRETKRLEGPSYERIRKPEAREEIIHRGYVTLKRIYELNPQLTESAAKKKICGPPGNHWMGLSRVEVLDIMRRIRKELGVPADKYKTDNPRMNFSKNRENKPKKKAQRKSKKSVPKERKPKKVQKVKTPIVPLQHIPGPKHLHTNVCIRPWEDTLDGWNHSQEGYDGGNGESSEGEAGKKLHLQNPPNSPRTGMNTLLDNDIEESAFNSADDDFITLEIFNPIFKVSR